MGASNALRAYAAWGPVLDDRPMRLLIYMALIARDGDAAPWYGLGHEALAEMGLGVKVTPASMRAVRRALTPLHEQGAIETARHSGPGKRVSYRLWLDGPPLATQDGERPMFTATQDGERPVNNSAEPVDNPPDSVDEAVDNQPAKAATQDGERPVNGTNIGRSVALHRTVSDLRPYKEEEEEELITTKVDVDHGEGWKAGCQNAAEPSGQMTKLEAAAWRALRAAQGAP